eukprot:1801845-Rhodomonas_salina.3
MRRREGWRQAHAAATPASQTPSAPSHAPRSPPDPIREASSDVAACVCRGPKLDLDCEICRYRMYSWLTVLSPNKRHAALCAA